MGKRKCKYVSTRLSEEGFEKVLKAYVKLHRRYKKFSDGDCAYDYTEMANVSMLASAASVAGWTALCEFQHVKPNKLDRRMNSNGRADLYLISDGEHGHVEYYCEAKQQIVGANRLNRDWKKTFKRSLVAAVNDTQDTCNVRKQDNHRGLALAFFNFYIKKTNLEKHNLIASEIFDYLRSDETLDAWALTMNKKPIESWYENSFSSGSLLVIKNVTR